MQAKDRGATSFKLGWAKGGTIKEHEESSESDEYVHYLDRGSGGTGTYRCPNLSNFVS